MLGFFRKWFGASSYPNSPPAGGDFRPPPAAPPSPGVWPRHLPNQIDAAPDGTGFVVGYGDYLSCVPVTADLGRLPRGQQLALALRATPGADAAAPAEVDHESVSGLMEDYFVRYECRLGASPANVLALRATRLVWTAAAERLAAPVDPPAEAVAAVREAMAALARSDVEAHHRSRDLLGRRSEAEPDDTAESRGAPDRGGEW